MIHLYIKQHNVTGLKYFGRTYQNPFKYKGSGKHWKAHLKIHGNDVSTSHIWSFNDVQAAQKFAMAFSIENNIVDDSSWANLIAENITGAVPGRKVHPDTIEKIRAANIGKKLSPEHIQKLRDRPGIPWTAEKRAKMAARVLDPERYRKQGEARRGIPRSDETKARVSASKKGVKFSEEHKRKLSEAAKIRCARKKEKINAPGL